jgi:transforming growth factor-beta-induced protein
MKKIGSMMLVFIFMFNIVSYAATEDIVDIATSNDDFSTLVAALVEADLVGALQGDGPFTVFAPTNEAFDKLLSSLGITAAELLAQPDLSKVLLYHVVSGKVLSTDLSDGLMAETLNGETITVDLSDGVKINQATVVSADIEATNGVVHVINEVLVPSDFQLQETMNEETAEATMTEDPSIVDIALGDDNFSMLVMLLQKADLVGALQGEGPFTVFAPTNDAFVELITALDITPDELMAQPDLAKVLLYHVVSGNVLSTDLSDGLSAPTLNGNTLEFDLDNGVMVNQANVVMADIKASNGVVHVIDSVLVPSDFALEEVNLEQEEIPKAGLPSTLPILFTLGAGAVAMVGSMKRKAK